MKAIRAREYGSPEQLRLEEVDIPAPKDDEVLIRVRAAALNALDYYMMGGEFMVLRPFFGWKRPKDPRVGADVAGIVEAVGANVTSFKKNDEVFGVARGSLAEFVATPANKIAHKSANASFEQAAAMPVAALTALQGLRDKARLARGQKVLINGAAGGIGTFAIQIARSMGAEVAAVCSARNVDLVRSLGATRVFDYTREDFTRSTERYDVFADIIGNRSLSECRGVMTPKGTFLNIGVRDGGQLIPRLAELLLSKSFVSQNLSMFVARMTPDDLNVLSEMIEAKSITPVIDRTYPLNQAGEALAYLKEGHARGKVVVTIN
jgi:NADPH:quinone reductase-like Zn-dependent oxidoreductase